VYIYGLVFNAQAVVDNFAFVFTSCCVETSGESEVRIYALLRYFMSIHTTLDMSIVLHKHVAIEISKNMSRFPRVFKVPL
jgi:hypothetical protein